MQESKRIILVDGNSLMFRSYYATAYTGNLMKNSSGLFTNAVFGFVNMITKLLSSEYDYVFVAFDKGKKTFRHQAYDDYKGGRKPMPDEFRVQIPYIKKYLDALNIYHEELDDFEADDLIASVSELAKNNGINDIMVVTGDKDLLQLVNDNIHVSLTKKGITELEDYTKENFFDKMGFYSYQIPDYKGLVGDTSDNLPGIKGIGEKTALKLMLEYKTLENIIADKENIKGKTGEVIRTGFDIGLKCKKLATLVRNINLSFTLDDLKKKDANREELINLFNELEFKSFLKKLDNESSNIEVKEEKKSIDVNVNFRVIDDPNYDFSTFKERYIVIEYLNDNYYNYEPLGIAFYTEKEDLFNENIFICFDYLKNNESFKKYMESDISKYTYDYKKLYVCMKKLGINISGVCYDLLLASYLINPKYASDDFKQTISSYLDYNCDSDDVIYGTGAKKQVPDINIYSTNAIKKAKIINLSKNEVLNKLSEFELTSLFEMEIKLSEVLGDMEVNGLIVDKDKLTNVGVNFEEKMKESQAKIYELAGEEFNINSVKQLGDILFNKLKLPVSKKNKTGYSTSVEVLEYLAKDYEIAREVLTYRTYSKLISTYVKGMDLVMDDNSYIHPLYKQALTMTGRLSSIEPNIQNMPIRTEEGQIIRDVFVSRFDGGKIMSIDYSQIELRVLAHMANDTEMINAFNSGEDFHKATAALIFNCKLDDVTKTMRRYAKAINFGIVYGMSAWGLSESIGITPKEASEYISKYFEKYYSIDSFLKNIVNDAKSNGYTKTMFNRIRYIPELSSMNKNMYQFGERTAMNAPIQGTAADIIKMAMVNVRKMIKENNYKSILIAQVHDELVFDCYPGEEIEMQRKVKNIMQNVCKLKVELIAESSIGDSWLKA